MSDTRFKPGTVCYFKLRPTSPDYWVNGMFVTITEKTRGNAGKSAWKFKPDIYSPRHKRNFEYAYEDTLVPIAGPTVDDVKDTLEVMSMANNTSFDALREIAKTVDRESALEEVK